MSILSDFRANVATVLALMHGMAHHDQNTSPPIVTRVLTPHSMVCMGQREALRSFLRFAAAGHKGKLDCYGVEFIAVDR